MEQERIAQERDLYRRLLELGAQPRIEPFLADALALVVEITGARRGYLELRDPADGEELVWWMVQGCSPDEADGIRKVVSRGIVEQAIAGGETIQTNSAALDPRFQDRQSVRVARIEAVLCAPVGTEPPLGVVYLEGRGEPGPWPEEAARLAESFARHLVPFADRLLVRERNARRNDATRALREHLDVGGAVGHSAALAQALEQVALVAPLDVNVLITGESGTGKTQLARLIHRNGSRAEGPLVELNCAALPEALIENELFGSREGGHSTARTAIMGKVAAAEGGTLFLDEIGELPASAQAKLLQLLQSKCYYPLGAAEPVTADVRLVAATNADLEQAVGEKRFREDLFWRLQVLPIRMPSLRERIDDLPALAEHFCRVACERHGLPRMELSRGALHAIRAAEWPGNVRQLENAVEAAVIRAAGSGSGQVEERAIFPAGPGPVAEGAPATFQEATRRFQATLLRDMLEETGWNVSETARRLDLARSHVYNLIRAFGLERS